MLRPALLTICLLLFCSFAIAVDDGQPTEAALRYIEEYKTIAISEMQRSGIPASIKMAQSIHESSWGRGSLALNSNNFFGIKCKEEWTGETFYKEDDDYLDGQLIKSCFRVYESIQASFEDHSNFLMNNSRYARLFQLERTDYVGWAEGLKACGYATDKKYAEKLIRTIREYELYQLDLPQVNMANLIVQPDFDALAQQDTVDPQLSSPNYNGAVAEEHYEVPAAFRLPDDYVRNSYTTPATPPMVNPQNFPTPAPTQEVPASGPSFDEPYSDELSPPVVQNTEPQEPVSDENEAFTTEYYSSSTVETPEIQEPAPAYVAPPSELATQTEYQPVVPSPVIPEPTPANTAQEQTTARQATAATAPRYSINPQLRNSVNKSSKRKSQTLQKSRTPQLSSSYRRR
ncbi:MAG: glucosaminidase domain-containing protein [Bacteroidota bacterium]